MRVEEVCLARGEPVLRGGSVLVGGARRLVREQLVDAQPIDGSRGVYIWLERRRVREVVGRD